MSQTNDPIERMLLKILLTIITAIIIVYIVKPLLGLFGIMPSTGDSFADMMMFFIVPVSIAFIAIYRVFKVFSA